MNKILIVDDELGIRLLLEEILKSEGYQIETAETGKEALEKLLEETFDLMIIDYKLPIMSGKEVLRQMNKRKLEIPVILMSGLIESMNNDAEQLPNVKGALAKPFNVVDVCNMVRSIMKNSNH